MSKPRYDWWPYVKGIIRRYPELAKRYADLHTTSTTAGYSLAPGGSGPSRSAESAALRELPTTPQREYEAVRQAIAVTERYSNGLDRLKVIRLVLWDKTHTLEGAALVVPCSYRTARRWHTEFIVEVAKNYGLMDEERGVKTC